MSKKEEAFEFFSQGKRPRDSEVKALGLNAKTLYNYFQEWKNSGVDVVEGIETDEISELRREKARLILQNQIQELEIKRESLIGRVAKLERQVVALAKEIDEDMFTINSHFYSYRSLYMKLAKTTSFVDQELWDKIWEDGEKEAIKYGQSTTSCAELVAKA